MHIIKTGTRALSDAEGFPIFLWFYYRLLCKRQIKDVCMKRKTWDTISFVIPFPRSSFLLPDIQIFGYSL